MDSVSEEGSASSIRLSPGNFNCASIIPSAKPRSKSRIRTLNALAENFQLDLFTRSDTSPLKKVHCHGGVSTHTQMPEIFYRSKINLNITMRPIQTGRMFFPHSVITVLSDSQPDIFMGKVEGSFLF